MGSLTVDLKALKDSTGKFKNLIEKSNSILNDYNSQENCIDYYITERDNIKYDLKEIGKQLQIIFEDLTIYDTHINDAIDAYADTEEKLKSFILELDTSDKKEPINNNAKPADVTVGKVKVRDSEVANGVTTGYLVDIIEGLGGTVKWDGNARTTTVKLNGKTIVYDLKNMKDGVGHASDGTTFYMHASKINVNAGDYVNIGDSLGNQGNQHPSQNFGNHVHVELREGRKLYGSRRNSKLESLDLYPYLVQSLGI